MAGMSYAFLLLSTGRIVEQLDVSSLSRTSETQSTTPDFQSTVKRFIRHSPENHVTVIESIKVNACSVKVMRSATGSRVRTKFVQRTLFAFLNVLRRAVRGLDPVHRLKARENAAGSENPTRYAVSLIETFFPLK